jgi:hypothetical protein
VAPAPNVVDVVNLTKEVSPRNTNILSPVYVSVDASNKRNLMAVGGHTDHVVDLCGEDSADGKCQCLGKGQTMLTQA